MRLVAALAPAALAAALAAPATAAPGTIAVGLRAEAPRAETAQALVDATGGRLVEDLGPLDALVLAVPDVRHALAVARGRPDVEYAERLQASRRLAWPDDELFPRQWYLPRVRAFDHWSDLGAPPPLPPVRVAIVDSGIDGSHPDLEDRIVAARSFVRGSARTDTNGHGTIIAGLIGAKLDTDGIAGAGIPVELLVAKVVRPDGGISILAEARAIRWAVNNGAKVINLSLGGPRNPNNPRRDTYSALEHAAVDYATRRGVLVVAAGGNCSRLRCPEPYASWPAALPHVLGVAALRPDGRTPAFSNRDPVHIDLAAPGTQMLSTYPRARSPVCAEAPEGYTPCAARASDRNPRGTSFSAPLVTAAAALLLAERSPGKLHASQIRTLLERNAFDIAPRGRDKRSGFGRLDVKGALDALARPLPPRDRYEANDDAGPAAWRLPGKAVRIRATVDPFDDRRDVYRVPLRKGQRVDIRLDGPVRGRSNLYLWRSRTKTLTAPKRVRRANRLASSSGPSWKERIVYRARARGEHFVEVRLPRGRAGTYTLTIIKS